MAAKKIGGKHGNRSVSHVSPSVIIKTAMCVAAGIGRRGEIQKILGLAPRTTKYALQYLKETGIIEQSTATHHKKAKYEFLHNTVILKQVGKNHFTGFELHIVTTDGKRLYLQTEDFFDPEAPTFVHKAIPREGMGRILVEEILLGTQVPSKTQENLSVTHATSNFFNPTPIFPTIYQLGTQVPSKNQLGTQVPSKTIFVTQMITSICGLGNFSQAGNFKKGHIYYYVIYYYLILYNILGRFFDFVKNNLQMKEDVIDKIEIRKGDLMFKVEKYSPPASLQGERDGEIFHKEAVENTPPSLHGDISPSHPNSKGDVPLRMDAGDIAEKTRQMIAAKRPKKFVSKWEPVAAELMEFWNSLPGTPKHRRKNTKVYRHSVGLLVQLLDGSWARRFGFAPDVAMRWAFLIERKKKFTPEEIRRTFERYAFDFPYLPEHHRAKSLERFIYNPNTRRSWFLQLYSNEHAADFGMGYYRKLLGDKPFERIVKWVNEYRARAGEPEFSEGEWEKFFRDVMAISMECTRHRKELQKRLQSLNGDQHRFESVIGTVFRADMVLERVFRQMGETPSEIGEKLYPGVLRAQWVWEVVKKYLQESYTEILENIEGVGNDGFQH